mmetsp:Transcript_49320/g.127212  ORF Transcript_49320/g.127212 Transcript_49320/m.127212 type:complete len:200 (-) Transcript_49320:2-601(-)
MALRIGQLKSTSPPPPGGAPRRKILKVSCSLMPNLASIGSVAVRKVSQDGSGPPFVTPFSRTLMGCFASGASKRRPSRKYTKPRLDGQVWTSPSPPMIWPGLYRSVVPVSSMWMSEPSQILSSSLTKEASKSRSPGSSSCTRMSVIVTGRPLTVARMRRCRRKFEPLYRTGAPPPLAMLGAIPWRAQGGAPRGTERGHP